MGSMSCKERPSTATAGDDTDEYIEAAVAETSELENGQSVQIISAKTMQKCLISNIFYFIRMKEVVVHENLKVLLVKDMNGEVTAIGTKCSHYGAPLIKGALGDGRVRCPWHGACFNTKTGTINQFSHTLVS